MGKRGPVPKAKKLEAHRLGGRAKVTAGRPERPEWLSEEAAAEWERVIPELLQLGTLAVIDRAALAAYCQAWSEFVALTATVQAEGRTWKEPIQSAGGQVIGHRIKTHPAVRQLDAASAKVKQYLVEFGLSPAARARMGADAAVAAAPALDPPPSKLGEIATRVQAARRKAPPKSARPAGD